MSNLRGLKKGVAKSTQKRATEAMPPMEQPVDQELSQGQDGAMAVADPDKMQEATPEQKRYAEGMHSAIINYMYRDETKGPIKEMLTSGKMEQTVPMAAQQIYTTFEMMLRNGGQPLDFDGKALASLIIFSEVVETGQALGVVAEDTPEEVIEQMMTKTLQDKIHEGLKDGSIDVVELQEKLEPYLDDDMKELGNSLGQEQGLQGQADPGMVAEQEKQRAMRPLQAENEKLKGQMQGQQTALKGMGMAQPQEQKPGQPGPQGA